MSAWSAAIVLLSTGGVQTSPAVEQYEILVSYETQSEGSDGSTGSSRGRNRYTETVYADDGECIERLFDSVDAPDQTRPLAEWQLPIRVRQCGSKAPTLANEEEMVARLEKFLSAIGATQEACGRYYFTWNIFQIECDSQAALEIVSAIDLAEINLADGAPFLLNDQSGAGTLTKVDDSSDGEDVFVAEGELDARFLRETAANTLKVVEELNGNTLSHGEAMESLAEFEYSGTFKAEFVMSMSAGSVRRTITTETREVEANGNIQTRRIQQVTERKKVEP